MALLTIEQCREHCRIIGSDNDSIIADCLASATDAAGAYLNRTIYETQGALDAAREGLPEQAEAAQATYEAAVTAAAAVANPAKSSMMLAIAEDTLRRWNMTARYTLHGIVVNDSILAAVKLILSHLFENTEAVMATNGTVTEIPLGAKDLLRPYRRRMTP